MAAIAAAPILLNNVTVTIGTDSYEAACTQVLLNPTTPVVRWKGMTPGSSHSFAGTPIWDATLTFAQDIASTNSLSKYLHNTPVGTKVTLAFDPVAGGASVTAIIVIQPAAIGGSLDTVPEATVTFAVDGQPTIAA
ncbi:hypothetical protein [Microbacterium sp. SLBN-146]|uniref:hypothetical protein n=1 Tax=Microbacterium sp. SLBN-146 TaxID=2768457 RepID=UPI001152007D|nr:hypothetical protein [Microbacterium sp. SLBN-146]TQJ31948.1 hypothetical protein FBY39_2437 [Microbacterium sp. SLBN-146]